MRRLGRRAALGGIAAAGLAAPALAQGRASPSGQIRVVVPFPAGGSTDAVAGNIDLIIGYAAVLNPPFSGSQLRPAVQIGTERLPGLADTLTMQQSCFDGIVTDAWWAVLSRADAQRHHRAVPRGAAFSLPRAAGGGEDNDRAAGRPLRNAPDREMETFRMPGNGLVDRFGARRPCCGRTSPVRL
jgi:hypothetical protein